MTDFRILILLAFQVFVANFASAQCSSFQAQVYGNTEGCSGQAVVLSAVPSPNTGTYTYQWKEDGVNIPGETNVVYSATSTGNYSVYMKLDGCSNNSTSSGHTVTFSPLPTLSFSFSGSNQVMPNGSGGYFVCESTTLVGNTNTGVTFLWKRNGVTIGGATTNSHFVNTDGNYSLTTTNSSGCSFTASISIVIRPQPVASITPSGPISFCDGMSVDLSTPTGTDFVYEWSKTGDPVPGATSNSYTASETGYYTVAVNNGSCFTTSDYVLVTVNPLPSASITPAGSLTSCGGNVVLNANTGSGLTYQWRKNGGEIGGAVLDSLVVTETGSYSVIVTNSFDCSATSAAVAVTIDEVPPAYIAPSDTDPCVGQEFFLTSSYRPGDFVQWIQVVNGVNNDVAGEDSVIFYPNSGGVFRVRITAPSGCENTSDPVTITYRQFPDLSIGYSGGNPVVNFGVDSAEVCGNTNLTAITSTGVSLKWMNGTSVPISSTYPVTEDGTYYVETTNAYGCASSKTINIVIKPLPLAEIDLGGPTTFCDGASLSIVATYEDGYSYQWLEDGYIINNETSRNFLTTVSGVYSVKVNDGLCFSISDTVPVTVSPLPIAMITPGGPTTTCGDSVSLGVSASSGLTYQWFDGANAIDGAINDTFQATETGIYSVSVSSGSCSSTSNDLHVTINSNREIDVLGSAYPCSSTPPALIISPADNMQWIKNGVAIPGETSATFVPLSDGNYSVRAVYDGCIDTTSVVVIVFSDCINHIRQEVVNVNDIREVGSVASLTVGLKNESTDYFDGLGRRVQFVAKQNSPNLYDIVEHVGYDQYNRQNIKYLPFAAENNGEYKQDIIDPATRAFKGVAESFYEMNSDNKIADDTSPFAETVFEASPLNRILKQGATGETWQPNEDPNSLDDKTIKSHYESNGSNVLLWAYDTTTHTVSAKNGSNLVYFDPNTLRTNKTYEEDNKLVIEYIDNEGKTILRRKQATSSQTPINDTNFASTYYIYDDFGDLVVVLPPEATKQMLELLTEN